MCADNRFGPTRRVKKRREYLTIQTQGKKLRTPHFLVAVSPSRVGTESRLGVTVTRKVDKRAVLRNRLKRRVRAYFRTNRERLVTQIDLVVIALGGACELAYDDIRFELEGALRRGKLVRRQG